MSGNHETGNVGNNEKCTIDFGHEDADATEKFDDDRDKNGHTDDNDSVDDDATALSFETEWSGDVDVADDHIFDEKRARMSLAKLFCTQAWPPQRVESKYFKQILEILNPQFQISKHTFRNDCLEFFEEEKAKIKPQLTNLGGHISLSVDILTRGFDYLCLKAHFIDDCWKLKSWILDYRRMWHPNEMATDAAIGKSLSEWGIESKVFTITMGNKFDDICEIVKDHIQGKNDICEILNGRLFRVYCCADMLSRMVQDGFEEISDSIFNIRLIVPGGRYLPIWYLILDRLQEGLRLESLGEFYSSDDYDGFDIPSPNEWKKIQGVCKLVQIIYNVAQILFDTKHYSAASVYLHSLQELRSNLGEECRNSDGFVSNLARKMLSKLEECWKNMFLVLSIATVMDPRCKMKFIEFSLSKFENGDCKSEATIVLEAVQRLYNDYATPIPESEYCASDLSSSESDEEECESSENAIKWLQEYEVFVQSSSQPLKSELDLYLEEPVVPWSVDFSALSWWRAASPKYPTVSKMARDFLAIPISLATSFEAYYTTQRPANECVVSVDRDIMNALMCTQSWSRRH